MLGRTLEKKECRWTEGRKHRDNDYKLFVEDGLLKFPRTTKETFTQPRYFSLLVENML